jgi:phosphoribosylamine--glycine ligase
MNVLVIGGGGREHAIAWRLAQSPSTDTVYCAPGNPGMRGIEHVPISDLDELAEFALANDVELTVVGPEAPLCAGAVNIFRARGLTIFGPDQAAAQLEGSKVFAKDFMLRHGLPTAAAETFTDAASAVDWIRDNGAPIVVKASGLAAGKGVTVAMNEDDAVAAVEHCFSGGFGEAGAEVLLEEYMDGEEASIFAFVDNHSIAPLESSQDHKRVGDGDTGPNTGGMGAYSPAPVVDDAMWKRIDSEILKPFLAGLQADGLDYRGIIYIGLMIDENGPRIVEFNVRFGDPEAQPILTRLRSDLAVGMKACGENRLAEYTFEWSPNPAVCVVLASGGYPGSYEKGKVISGIDAAEALDTVVFHAGTRLDDGQIVNNGGRVLGVTAARPTIAEAIDAAYAGARCISWDGMFYRNDIGYRALQREGK